MAGISGLLMGFGARGMEIDSPAIAAFLRKAIISSRLVMIETNNLANSLLPPLALQRLQTMRGLYS